MDTSKVWKFIALIVIFSLALAACASATEEAPKEFVFGVILVGPKNDHGWSQAHYEGGLYVEQNLPGARMIVFESLNPADKPEATLEGVVDDMVAQGAQLVFTTSDEFEEDTVGAAEKYPDVTFISVSGDDAWAEGQDAGVAPPNEGNFMGQMPPMKAIAGCAAALATDSGKIAYLGPLINFETRRLASSAYLGAAGFLLLQSFNPCLDGFCLLSDDLQKALDFAVPVLAHDFNGLQDHLTALGQTADVLFLFQDACRCV